MPVLTHGINIFPLTVDIQLTIDFIRSEGTLWIKVSA